MWRCVTLTAMLAVSAAAASDAPTGLIQNDGNKCGEQECDGLSQYCDRFQSECRPCRQHCAQADLRQCEIDCPKYLKALLFTANSQEVADKSDVRTLEIMLVAVSIVSSMTLLTVMVLLVLRIRGKRRREKEVIPMHHFPTPPRPRSSTPNDTTANNHSHSYFERQIPSPPPPPSHAASTNLPNGLGRSMQTVTTQLSEETNSSTMSRRPPQHQISVSNSRSSFQNGGGRFQHKNRSPPLSRIPAEDRIPDESPTGQRGVNGGYDNPAVKGDNSSSGPTSPVTVATTNVTSTTRNRMPPPLPGPYTISHSQVL